MPYFRKALNPFQLDRFCAMHGFEALISGDDMIAYIYDIETGLWVGVMSLC